MIVIIILIRNDHLNISPLIIIIKPQNVRTCVDYYQDRNHRIAWCRKDFTSLAIVQANF